MLEYYLELNELTEDQNDYRAQVVNVRSYSTEDIINRIMQIGAGLTRSDILSVIEAEKQVCSAIIAEGGAINTELWSAHPSIRGVFTASAEVDPHRVHLNLNAGKVLRDAIVGMQTKKVTPPQSGTIIESVFDVKSGSRDFLITPNRDIRITGVKLKIAGDNAANGVYFTNTAGQGGVKVDPTDIVENNPSSLLVVVPNLTPNSIYKLKIVTQYSGTGTLLQTPRETFFSKTLTTASPAQAAPEPAGS